MDVNQFNFSFLSKLHKKQLYLLFIKVFKFITVLYLHTCFYIFEHFEGLTLFLCLCFSSKHENEGLHAYFPHLDLVLYDRKNVSGTFSVNNQQHVNY